MERKDILFKIIVCSLFAIILLNCYCVPSTYAIGDVFSDAAGFLQKGNDINEVINNGALKSTSDYIFNALLIIGVMIAVIVAMILGIQFMLASAGEKAKVKESIIPFVVGCIVVFGAFPIWRIIINIGNNAEKSIDVPAVSIVPDDLPDEQVLPTYPTFKEVAEELEKDSRYIQDLTDDELRKLYEEVNSLMGPFSVTDNKIIEEVNYEYKKRKLGN